MGYKIKQFEFESSNGDRYTFEVDSNSFFLYSEDDNGKEVITLIIEREDIPDLISMLQTINEIE